MEWSSIAPVNSNELVLFGEDDYYQDYQTMNYCIFNTETGTFKTYSTFTALKMIPWHAQPLSNNKIALLNNDGHGDSNIKVFRRDKEHG